MKVKKEYLNDGEIYVLVYIKEANGGFDMYEGRSGVGDIDAYWNLHEFLAESGAVDHLCTLDEDWEESDDTELVNHIRKITGKCYNEPPILLACRDGEDNVYVYGWEGFDRNSDTFLELRERYGDWDDYEWLFE